jgi:hypothetical protein
MTKPNITWVTYDTANLTGFGYGGYGGTTGYGRTKAGRAGGHGVVAIVDTYIDTDNDDTDNDN